MQIIKLQQFKDWTNLNAIDYFGHEAKKELRHEFISSSHDKFTYILYLKNAIDSKRTLLKIEGLNELGFFDLRDNVRIFYLKTNAPSGIHVWTTFRGAKCFEGDFKRWLMTHKIKNGVHFYNNPFDIKRVVKDFYYQFPERCEMNIIFAAKIGFFQVVLSEMMETEGLMFLKDQTFFYRNDTKEFSMELGEYGKARFSLTHTSFNRGTDSTNFGRGTEFNSIFLSDFDYIERLKESHVLNTIITKTHRDWL